MDGLGDWGFAGVVGGVFGRGGGEVGFGYPDRALDYEKNVLCGVAFG